MTSKFIQVVVPMVKEKVATITIEEAKKGEVEEA